MNKYTISETVAKKALATTIASGSLEDVIELLDTGIPADVMIDFYYESSDQFDSGNVRMSAINYVLEHFVTSTARKLILLERLAKNGASLDSDNAFESVPLHTCLRLKENLAEKTLYLDFLLNAGVNVRAKFKKGYNLLHLCASADCRLLPHLMTKLDPKVCSEMLDEICDDGSTPILILARTIHGIYNDKEKLRVYPDALKMMAIRQADLNVVANTEKGHSLATELEEYRRKTSYDLLPELQALQISAKLSASATHQPKRVAI